MPSQNDRTGPADRVQGALHHWQALQDQYVVNIVREGLKLSWCEGFDASNPPPDGQVNRPARSFNKEDLSSEVKVILQEMLDKNLVSEIAEKDTRCQSQIFVIPKKRFSARKIDHQLTKCK